MGSRSTTPPTDSSSLMDAAIRKRVCKACDRCRLKKSKCNGESPCSRCKADNAICVFGERKKSHDKVYPKGYVEMLENQQTQLVTGLQELYRKLQAGERWSGAPLKTTTNGTPLTHEILERLGALKQDGVHGSEVFEENLEALQNRLFANGASFMQRGSSFDAASDVEQSPVFEPVNFKSSHFPHTWTMNQLPPTPPTNSPRPSITKTPSPLSTRVHTSTPQYTEQSPVFSDPTEYLDTMEYNMTYESPVDFSVQNTGFPSQMYYDATSMIINPYLTMKDGWQFQDEQFQHQHSGGVFT